LKPSNILINERCEALIADFGTTRSECDAGTLTSDTGTVHYAAPEMYKEAAYFSNEVDVFSFGLIMCEILTGRPVFAYSMMPFPIMRKVLTGNMPVIPARVGTAMQSLIARCWSMTPEDRPSFDDILKEFQDHDFAVFPGASSSKIFEYVQSVLDWEMGCARSCPVCPNGFVMVNAYEQLRERVDERRGIPGSVVPQQCSPGPPCSAESRELNKIIET
jgi:serine/threonine protein kinase